MWRAIAPVWDYHDRSNQVRNGVDLGRGVRLARTPEWMTSEPVTRYLAIPMRDRVCFESPFSLQLDYEASRIEEPDPGRVGWTSQQTADEVLRLASFAMWIARPARVGFEVVVHSSEPDRAPPGMAEIHPAKLLLPHDSDVANELTQKDFDLARRLQEVMLDLPGESTINTAVGGAAISLQMSLWELRYLLMWVALESLFGPEDSRETTYRISQRIAFFVSSNRRDAAAAFDAVKRAYGMRSKVVHGARVAGVSPDEKLSLQSEVETLVRRSLTKILIDGDLARKFEAKQNRERFLDQLAFEEVKNP